MNDKELDQEIEAAYERDPDGAGWVISNESIKKIADKAVVAELTKLRNTKASFFPPNGIYEISMAAVTVNDIDDRISKLTKEDA